jgi:hypothetical protein
MTFLVCKDPSAVLQAAATLAAAEYSARAAEESGTRGPGELPTMSATRMLMRVLQEMAEAGLIQTAFAPEKEHKNHQEP